MNAQSTRCEYPESTIARTLTDFGATERARTVAPHSERRARIAHRCAARLSQSHTDVDLIRMTIDPADERAQSWAYWSFKSFDDITTTGDAGGGGESLYNKDGSVQDGKLRTLTRAYARAIAGRPTKIKFENASGEEQLTLQYTVGGLPFQ